MNKHFFVSDSYQLLVKYYWVSIGHISVLNVLIRTRIFLQLSKVIFNHLVKASILNLAYFVKKKQKQKKSLIYHYMNMQWCAHKKWAKRWSYYLFLSSFFWKAVGRSRTRTRGSPHKRNSWKFHFLILSTNAHYKLNKISSLSLFLS